ncbi:Crp/Fnr family transcriptional regulator [Micromonospora sp. PTRAS2]
MDDDREHRVAGLPAYLSAQDWADLQTLGSRHTFDVGVQLLRQGDEGDFVHVILRGAVKVVRSEPSGGRTILTIRGAGDVVGDWAALDGRRRFASVSALTTLTCRLLTGSAFRRFVEKPAVAAAFARYNVTRSREADVQRTELAVLPVRQRLARALLRLHEAASGGFEPAGVDLPQQDLAELVGASRNAVVLALGVLRAEGVVDTRRRRVTVCDVSALHRIASLDHHSD